MGGSIAAAGGLGSAAIGASAANKAASTQAQAAQNAAQLQQQASNQALDFTKQQLSTSQNALAPYQQAGAGGLSKLQYLLGIGGNSSGQSNVSQGTGTSYNPNATTGGTQQQGTTLTDPSTGLPASGINATSNAQASMPVAYDPSTGQGVTTQPGQVTSSGQLGASGPNAINQTATSGTDTSGGSGGYGSLLQSYGQQFTAPTGLTEQNDPGYQARLALGTDAIQRSAAARGSVLTGGTAKALDTYAQDYASNEYGNVYNRALQGYQTNYNVWNNDNSNIYNRLMGLTGIGQEATNTAARLGSNASQQVSNNLLSTAQNVGQQGNNAAAATASGYMGSANAWGGALNGIGNNFSSLYQLKNGANSNVNYNTNTPYSSELS